MLKLFDFLAQMSEEKYPVRIDYREHMGCVDVEVDAFSERWIVSFDEDGFVDFVIYKDIDAPDNENVTLLESLFNRPQQACALSAWDCFTRVGPAEGERAIAQAIVYLACAPKSNASLIRLGCTASPPTKKQRNSGRVSALKVGSLHINCNSEGVENHERTATRSR